MRPGDKNSLSFNRLSFIIDWFLGLPSLSLARPFRVPPWRLDASAWASPSNYGLSLRVNLEFHPVYYLVLLQ